MYKSSTERTEIYRCVKTCVLYPGIGSSEMIVARSIHYRLLSYIFFCQATEVSTAPAEVVSAL